jgi:FkbM family methyltransferase
MGSVTASDPAFELAAVVMVHDVFSAIAERLPDQGDILDVGARNGDLTAQIARLRPRCRVHAIEPNPSRIRQIASLAPTLSNVSLVPCGFSDREKIIDFSDHPDCAGLMIAAMPLDAYVGQKNIDLAAIIISSKSNLPDILAGGKKALEQFRPYIGFEFSPSRLTYAGHDLNVFTEDLFQENDISNGAELLNQRESGVVLMRRKAECKLYGMH